AGERGYQFQQEHRCPRPELAAGDDDLAFRGARSSGARARSAFLSGWDLACSSEGAIARPAVALPRKRSIASTSAAYLRGSRDLRTSRTIRKRGRNSIRKIQSRMLALTGPPVHPH